VEAFLQARIDGEGAEEYFGGGGVTAPLLYATSSGAPYQRYEYELVSGPGWPKESMLFEVRLFTEDSQTVEQSFWFERDEAGQWGLENDQEAVENGQAISGLHDVLGGEVTFRADLPWDGGLIGPLFDGYALLIHPDGYMRILSDPLPVMGCDEGPAPANAEALAQSILTNGDFEATAPSAVTIGGAPALQMDVENTAGSLLCDPLPRSGVTRQLLAPGEHMRLYLVDLPGGSARILSIEIVAPESTFDRVVELAAPIIDSFEFHTG
jgi:hypothetical protein